jgi:calcium release-activated calcium channel protein 1
MAADLSDAATAFLTALDTSLARAWREEDRAWRREERQWRREDLEFRVEERDWWQLEHLHRDENRKWRRQDVEQRVLENARWIWGRYVEKNRRDVEEKGEQLRTTSNLSALISGFAVVALVELQFSDPTTTPNQSETLIAAYACTTAITVVLMLNSMVLCSFMLSNILRNGKTYVSEDEEAEFLYACRAFALSYKPGDVPPMPRRSFERYWETRCERDWRTAFRMFTYGVPMFVATLTLSTWLKFWYSTITCSVVTGVAGIGVIVWYRTQSTWGWHLMRRSESQLSKSRFFPPEGLPFDWHARPRHQSANSANPSDFEVGTSGKFNDSTPVNNAASHRHNKSISDEDFFHADADDTNRASPELAPKAHQPTLTVNTRRTRDVDIESGGRSSADVVSSRELDFLRKSSPRAARFAKHEFEKVGLRSTFEPDADDTDADDTDDDDSHRRRA